LRQSYELPVQTELVLGATRGTTKVAWRTWDDAAQTWDVAFNDPIWADAQTAYDRHVANDWPDIVTGALECLQVAGRFALVSYPIGPDGKVRRYPVDEYGTELRHPNYIALTDRDYAKVQATPRFDAFVSSREYIEWADAQNDRGLWKTRAVRVSAVAHSQRGWKLTVSGDSVLMLPAWGTIIAHVVRDDVSGACPRPGWVQTAVVEGRVYEAASFDVLTAVTSQMLAPFALVPSQAEPYHADQLDERLFAANLLNPALLEDNRNVSAGSYLGAMLATAAQELISASSRGGSVRPTVLDIDGDYIDKIVVKDFGRPIDPKLVTAWKEALLRLVQVADTANDSFFGVGSASGFNRNIGDTIADSARTDATRRAQWIADRVCDTLIRPYLWSQGGQRRLLAQVQAVELFVDPASLQTPVRLSASDVVALVTADVITPETGAQMVGVPAAPTADAPTEGNGDTGDVASTARVPVVAADTDTDFDLGAELFAIQDRLFAELGTALEAVMNQAGDRVGAVLRSKENAKDRGRASLLAGVANSDVAATLGQTRVRALLAGISSDEADQESHLFEKAIAVLVLLWNKKAKTAWRRIKAAFVRAGIYATIDDATPSDSRVDELIAMGAAVLTAGAIDLFRDRLLYPAMSDSPSAVLTRVTAGEPAAVGVQSTVARTVTAAGGVPVDAETTDPGTLNPGMLGPGSDAATVLTDAGWQIVGYEWDYGTEPRTDPAPWHVDNAALGVVETIDMFEGHVGDHKGCLCHPVKVLWGQVDNADE